MVMTKQIINIGTSPNSRDGDPIRAAFQKVNENFTELYNLTQVESLTELAQDYAAEMFLNESHEGITVEYDDENNKFIIRTIFDGDYTNLSNTPTIPTDIGDLTDNQGILLGLADNIDGGSAATVFRLIDFGVDGNGASVIYSSGEKQINGGGA
jgi:hypothetical protein